MLLNNIKEGINDLNEIMECDFKETTHTQKDIIKKNFNVRINFEYCEDGGYNFIMSPDAFKSFEYYLGMEYEHEHIEIKLDVYNAVLIVYNYDCERAKELIELLENEN